MAMKTMTATTTAGGYGDGGRHNDADNDDDEGGDDDRDACGAGDRGEYSRECESYSCLVRNPIIDP